MRPFYFFVMSNNLKLIISGCQAMSGLPLDSAHIDGLSALYIHENLGIEMVMDAFVRYVAIYIYMVFVKDKIYPNKAYLDLCPPL